MNKRLTAKTQYLNPTLGENVRGFSKAISVEPDNDDLLIKRGTIFAVFSITGGSTFDTNLISKVVHDVLHDSYFQSDNISPIQSMEKAISEVRDRVIMLPNETISSDVQTPTFSIVTAVLWGNVIYVVQYGPAQSYLVREGSIKPIATMSEGTYAATSGVVRNDDVIILCSKEFGKKYPPEKLMSTALGEQELAEEDACVLLKFIIDTSFSQNEVVDFGLDKQVTKENVATKYVENLKRLFAKTRTHKKPTKLTVPQDSNKIEITKAEIASITSLSGTGSVKGIKLKKPHKFSFALLLKPFVLIPLIAVALGISVFFTLKNKSKPATIKQPEATEIVKETTSSANNESTPSDTDVKGAEDMQAEGIFYDLKLVDINAKPNGIAAFKNTVIVTDPTTGNMYASNMDQPKFEIIGKPYLGINNILNIGGKLGFTDNSGYKVYDITNDKLAEEYTFPADITAPFGATSAYLSYVYNVNGDVLSRYSKSDSKLTGSVWAQTADFENAKSISVAYSIYVITGQGNLVSYTGGKKDKFELTGEKATLTNPVQVVADIDYKYIYVADAGNQRVAAYDDKGNFVKEFRAPREGLWNDIKKITVSPDEKTIFVLTGTKVYKVKNS